MTARNLRPRRLSPMGLQRWVFFPTSLSVAQHTQLTHGRASAAQGAEEPIKNEPNELVVPPKYAGAPSAPGATGDERRDSEHVLRNN